MKWLTALAVAVCCFGSPEARAQSGGAAADEPVAVVTEHPRLFLGPARLRLLKRERERDSIRWQQVERLMASGARLPEPGFAQALYYQVSGDTAAGRKAVAWALGPEADLRQMALVYDWCQDLMNDSERSDLAGRMSKAAAALSSDESVPAMRSLALAGVALYDSSGSGDLPRRELERLVNAWWKGKIAKALDAGRDVLPRRDAYALFELLHAVRDSAKLDLREFCPRYFTGLPVERLMGYYPAVFESADGAFRAGIASAASDEAEAALAREADLAIVAFDADAPESQALQGWLMHDRFMLRSAAGAPYEFLWANPYQPGLSYYSLPPVYYDSAFGKLFARSNWEDSAAWFGWFESAAHEFRNGTLTAPAATPRGEVCPIRFDSAIVCLGSGSFRLKRTGGQRVFAVGLEPGRTRRVEIEGAKAYEAATDPGGVMELHLPAGKDVGVRIR